MIRFIFTILVFMLFFSCEAKKNVVENTAKEEVQFIEASTEKVTDSIVFHFQSSHPNNTSSAKTKDTIQNDSTNFINNAKFTSSKPLPTLNHKAWNTLVQKHVTKDGIVNYKGFKTDKTELQKYITSLSENIPKNDWPKKAKLAYWINAYNALTVDLILRNYPTKSIKDIKKPWNQRLWKLGDKWYNLDEIEHKILRKMNEPRIHFAINCASFSCPPLLNEAFSEAHLEAQLTQVTKVFLADLRRNTITANTLEISKIFKWFSKDFKQNGSLIDFLNRYSDIKINENAKKNYKEYDWNLNE